MIIFNYILFSIYRFLYFTCLRSLCTVDSITLPVVSELVLAFPDVAGLFSVGPGCNWFVFCGARLQLIGSFSRNCKESDKINIGATR